MPLLLLLSTYVKLRQAQLSKTVQSGRLIGALLFKLTGQLMIVTIPLVKTVLVPLAIVAPASTIDGPIKR